MAVRPAVPVPGEDQGRAQSVVVPGHARHEHPLAVRHDGAHPVARLRFRRAEPGHGTPAIRVAIPELVDATLASVRTRRTDPEGLPVRRHRAAELVTSGPVERRQATGFGPLSVLPDEGHHAAGSAAERTARSDQNAIRHHHCRNAKVGFRSVGDRQLAGHRPAVGSALVDVRSPGSRIGDGSTHDQRLARQGQSPPEAGPLRGLRRFEHGFLDPAAIDVPEEQHHAVTGLRSRVDRGEVSAQCHRYPHDHPLGEAFRNNPTFVDPL